jgi:hypothetical protein
MDFVSLEKIDLIQLNKFSKLHDGANVIFCKTDYILSEFEYINNLSNDVILITGNSDYGITDDIIKNMPKNILKWYGQNVLTFHDKIEPIPMGLENKLESFRYGHGVGYYERVEKKEEILNKNFTIKPDKFIYSNFQVNTNFHHRMSVKDICIKSNHIEWEEPNLSIDNFFNRILEYEMVVCPAGNGVDTHRIWEVLYSKRIPITIKIGNYKIYDLYEKLPIIILDSIYDLENYDLIKDKLNHVKSKLFNLNLLDSNYWMEFFLKN